MAIVKNIEEVKKILGLETKAETFNTENTGNGMELVPKEEFSRSVFEEIRNESKLLSILPGFHGSVPVDLVVPVIGEFWFFENAPEYTDTTQTLPYNYRLPNTGQIKLSREKLIMTIPVSDELLAAGIDIEKYIRSGLAWAGSRTSESIIINADNSTGTGNINDKGATVSAGDPRHWFRNHGLRKTALSQSASLDVWALSEADLYAIKNLLGSKASVGNDCLWITNTATSGIIAQLPTLMNAYQSGRTSTLLKGMESNILGSDIYIARDLLLTDATGAVTSTPASNVKGSILYLNKSAPQFGYTDLKIEPKRIEGYGWHFVSTYYFAHAIASKLVGITEPSVALGYNVTV